MAGTLFELYNIGSFESEHDYDIFEGLNSGDNNSGNGNGNAKWKRKR